MKTIDLYDLQVEVLYEYSAPQIGGVFKETGEVEMISAGIRLTSVKCRGVEIITIIPEDQLLEMEQEILTELANRN